MSDLLIDCSTRYYDCSPTLLVHISFLGLTMISVYIVNFPTFCLYSLNNYLWSSLSSKCYSKQIQYCQIHVFSTCTMTSISSFPCLQSNEKKNICYLLFLHQTFTGNRDQNTIVEQRLSTPVTALCVRLYPLTWLADPCMRMEVLGCVSTNV